LGRFLGQQRLLASRARKADYLLLRRRVDLRFAGFRLAALRFAGFRLAAFLLAGLRLAALRFAGFRLAAAFRLFAAMLKY